MGRSGRRAAFYIAVALFLTVILYRYIFEPCGPKITMVARKQSINGPDNKVFEYHREMPLIFIGGVPRSGTTLMRAMLDAHPEIRCGQETRVIPRILQMRNHWLHSEKESLRLEEAGLTKSVIDSAIAAFCLEVIAKHGDPAPRLCNKDPLTLKSAAYLADIFPNSKFLFMVRDGRATVHSIISRKVTITGFDLSSYRQCLNKWNSAVQIMYHQCNEVGKDRCLQVRYEQLVLHPKKTLEEILEFLGVPWDDNVLHHEQQINKPGGVSLSKVERSSDQVIKPINLQALTKWVGNIPKDVEKDMGQIAPMIDILGYNSKDTHPTYGSPDQVVAENTDQIQKQAKEWEKKVQNILKNPVKKVEKQEVNNIENEEKGENDV